MFRRALPWRGQSASGIGTYLCAGYLPPLVLRAQRRLHCVASRRDTGRSGAEAAFVGRAAELRHLDRALGASASGSGATALIAGEAGIGKTRLVSELARRARRAPIRGLGRPVHRSGRDGAAIPPVRRCLGSARASMHADSQLRLFDSTLALLTERTRGAPCCSCSRTCTGPTSRRSICSSFSHTAWPSPRLALVGTYRADEPSSAQRMGRLADGVRHSGTALLVELGPLGARRAHRAARLPRRDSAERRLLNTILARSEGNPFFAEELLAAAAAGDGTLPARLRDVLLQRVVRLAPADPIRAAGGRRCRTRCRLPLLVAVAAQPTDQVNARCARRASKVFSSRTRRPAASGSATPCSRRRSTRPCCLVNASRRTRSSPWRSPAAMPRRPSSRGIGRRRVARRGSCRLDRGGPPSGDRVRPRRGARPSRAGARAVAAVPAAAEISGLDLAELTTWTAELASRVGAAAARDRARTTRDRARRRRRPAPRGVLHVRLGEYLDETGRRWPCSPRLSGRSSWYRGAAPPGARVCPGIARGGIDGGLAPSRSRCRIAEQALALARQVGAREAEVRALTVLGADLA